jgi:hypothetical protein
LGSSVERDPSIEKRSCSSVKRKKRGEGTFLVKDMVKAMLLNTWFEP